MKSVFNSVRKERTSKEGRGKRLLACFFVLLLVVTAVPQVGAQGGSGSWLTGAPAYAAGGFSVVNSHTHYAEVGTKNVDIIIEVKNNDSSAQKVEGTLTSDYAGIIITNGSSTTTTIGGGETGLLSFRLNVDNAASERTYQLKLNLNPGSEYSINLEVMPKTSSPVTSGNYIISTDMDVAFSNPEGIVAGETTDITLTIYNRSNSLMKGAVATIKLPDGLYISNGSSSQSLGYLAIGDQKSATFSVTADEDIESKSYAVDVAIDCKDGSNNDSSVSQTIYVPVVGTSSKTYKLDSIEITDVTMPDQINQEEECNLRFIVRNNGSKTISDMQVKAEIPDGLINTTRTLFAIDSLEPGASQNFMVTVASTDKTEEQFYAIKLSVESTSDKASGSSAVTQYTGTFVKEVKKGGTEKTPQLMVQNYTYGGIYVQAGNNFTLNLGLLNTSSTDLYNIKVTVSSDDGSFIPLNSASFHLDEVLSKGSTTRAISMTSKRDSDEKTSSLTVDMSYEDEDGNEFTSKDIISIPIMQDTKLVVGELTSPRDVMVGNQSRSTVEFYNMGKTPLNNLRVSASGNFTSDSSNFYYAGNLQPGNDDSYSFSFIPMEEGMVTGTISFTYEGSSGTPVTIDQPFEFAVMEMPVWDEEDWFDPFPEEESKTLPKYTIGLGVAVVVIIIAFFIFKKLRKSKLDKELEIDE